VKAFDLDVIYVVGKERERPPRIFIRGWVFVVCVLIFLPFIFCGCSKTLEDERYMVEEQSILEGLRKDPFIQDLQFHDVNSVNCENTEDPNACLQEVEFMKKQNKLIAEKLKLFRKYQDVFDKSPVPGFVMDGSEFYQKYLSKKESGYVEKDLVPNLSGMWVPKCRVSGWPEQFMYIKYRKDPDKMIVTLFHEIGHYMCFKGGCFCLIDETEVFKEIHAIEHELHALEMHGFDEALCKSIISLETIAVTEKFKGIPMQEAVIMVIQEDFFKEMKARLKKLGYEF